MIEFCFCGSISCIDQTATAWVLLILILYLIHKISIQAMLFSSLEPSAQVIKICPLSVVVVVVVVAVVNFSHFDSLDQFQPNLAKIILGWRVYFSLFKWRASPFSKERWLRNSENTLPKFKNHLPQYQWANFNQT